ncbi:helix-turn-helix domain-containing protein [Goodfellowiella coeruleoviolacea]|uniref:Helix-turn-helix domain-containing protein n=1 Tax=Goodfellowiella coeruleoviolacea TaxID=334858 RepID=A0AAE3GH05_9PSEU|nr:helix-turn-helix transcriptional regulator [Goodfellowiella coeruleoviolacea]MCP2165973.1 Helix-turn-helix domain-containing protein [Goodfellowiella coeruleoviolacea]
MPGTPTRWKKRLGAYLEHLRTRAGRSTAEAGKLIGVAGPTISRYETGHVRPKRTSVEQLLKFYGATDDEAAEALALWDDAGTTTTRVRLPVDASNDLRSLVRAEREAELIRTLAPSIVPGLLQTEGYIRALNAAAHLFLHPAAKVDGYVTARLARQKILMSPAAPRLHVLMDEAAVRRVVGGPDVMREQLGHLLAMGARSNITIQVIPYAAGAYGTMSGPCLIINYPDPQDPPGVYLEYMAGGRWVENQVDLSRIISMFAEISAAALPSGASADLILDQLKQLEGHR